MSARVDWFRVIVDLERAGYSHERIGAECLRGKTWAFGLKNWGSEPRYADGVALLDLWSRAVGKPCASAPTVAELVGNPNAA